MLTFEFLQFFFSFHSPFHFKTSHLSKIHFHKNLHHTHSSAFIAYHLRLSIIIIIKPIFPSLNLINMSSSLPQKNFSEKKKGKRKVSSSSQSPPLIPKKSRTKIRASKDPSDARIPKNKRK